MKTLTPTLAAMLNSQQFLQCKLFTFTTNTGQMYFWTDADVDVVCNGQVFSSSGPSINGAKFHMVRGLQVDTITLKVLAKPTDLIGGVTWSIASRSGALDGTIVKIDKAFLPAWGQPAQSINFFTGMVGEAVDGEIVTELSVVSDDSTLNNMIPALVYQPGCLNTLYGSSCGVKRANFQKSGSVTSVSDLTKFGTSLTDADGYYGQGTVTFVSGQNSGVQVSIRTYVSSVMTLTRPLSFSLNVGDEFVAAAGCDSSLGVNGCAKFNNEANYKGTPYIPPPEVQM